MALGLNVDEPETACDDQHCPFHGSLSVRGATLVGRVASTDMEKTAVVEREYDVFVPKYDRYMKRRSRVPAHAPPCLSLAVGDTVRIAETRPLSKTKSHVVVERLGRAGEHVAETAHVTPASERAADRSGDVGADRGGNDETDDGADDEGGEA